MFRVRVRGIAALCGVLLAACAAAGPPAVPAPASSAAARPPKAAADDRVAPVPVVATAPQDVLIAMEWNHLLEHGDAEKVMGTYEIIPKIESDDGGVKADACKAHADELEAALKINPVGLALWYDAYQCAKALGQADLAEQRLQSFTRVVGFALRSAPPDWGDTPIRVLHFDDIAAFIQASGEKVLNLYVDRLGGSRYLPVTVLLLDATSHRQRRLTFDFLDSFMRMQRDPNAQFPVFRNAVAMQIVRELEKSTGARSPFAQAVELDEALGKDDLESRIKALESAAATGNYVATLRLAAICLFGHPGHCGTQAVDALLPWAEKRDPEAMLWLAIAYADGDGVKADAADARRLVEAADNELGDIRIAYAFASLREGQAAEIDPVVRPIIEAQARAHEPHAEFVIAETARNAPEKHPLSPAVRAGLEHAAESGLPEAQRLLADILFGESQRRTAMEWLLKAAKAGDSRAQQDLANHYAELFDASRKAGKQVPEDRELAREWNVRASQDGRVGAMLRLGYSYMNLPPTKDNLRQAQGWMQSAAAAGSTEGLLALGDLYATNAPGLDGDAGKAAQLYQSVLDSNPDNPNARLGLAELLVTGKGVAKNLPKARQLRTEAAATGNSYAEYILGKDLLNGESGSKDPGAGIEWLKKSMKQGNGMAKIRYADALFHGDGVKRDVEAALRLWQSALDQDQVWLGINDGAWYLCTSADPRLFDGARGLHFANELSQVLGIGAAELDTIAACHAAVDDFDGAMSFEKKAIDQAEQMQPRPAKMIDDLRQRQQLYGQHKRYTEPSA
jgi:TPR repeat protein